MHNLLVYCICLSNEPKFVFVFVRFRIEQPVYINIIRDPISRFLSNYFFRRFGDWRGEQNHLIRTPGMKDDERYLVRQRTVVPTTFYWYEYAKSSIHTRKWWVQSFSWRRTSLTQTIVTCCGVTCCDWLAVVLWPKHCTCLVALGTILYHSINHSQSSSLFIFFPFMAVFPF